MAIIAQHVCLCSKTIDNSSVLHKVCMILTRQWCFTLLGIAGCFEIPAKCRVVTNDNLLCGPYRTWYACPTRSFSCSISPSLNEISRDEPEAPEPKSRAWGWFDKHIVLFVLTPDWPILTGNVCTKSAPICSREISLCANDSVHAPAKPSLDQGQLECHQSPAHERHERRRVWNAT